MKFPFFGGADYEKIDAEGYQTEFFADNAAHTLVDVRTPREYQQAHIPGAVLIPLNELQNRMAEIPQDKPAIIVCATGNRSASASSVLKRAGYESVFNLEGGTVAWMRRGFPVE